MRARKKIDPADLPRPIGADTGIDVNAVVSFNLKAIRERNGWTQQEVADNLGRLTGHTLPQASISAMERGFDGERRRRFDAHELYLLSVLFRVPIAYFFVPPPGSERKQLADTGDPLVNAFRLHLKPEYLKNTGENFHFFQFDHNGTGYTGATSALLQASYDAGIKNITVKSANSTTYCIESTVGNSVYKKAGPGATISSGACP